MRRSLRVLSCPCCRVEARKAICLWLADRPSSDLPRSAPPQGYVMKALLRGFARALPEEELLAASAPHDSSAAAAAARKPSRRALRARRRELLRQAVAEHAHNWDPRSDAAVVRYADDVGPNSKARERI